MLKASPESPRLDNEDFDDVFSDYPCQISNKRNKQDIIDNRDNRDIKYSLDESMPLYPLKDLNQSLDSAPFTEPYRRRGSVAKIDKRRPSQCQNSGHISFAEILSHFQNQEACKMQKILSEQDAKKGNAKILGIFSQYPKLPRHLETEKDIFLLMAETRYDRAEPIHLLILQSIHSKVLGGPVRCPALGEHWTDLGFNHKDPSVDLNSAKILGAVCLLFFVTHHQTLAESVYRLSTKSQQSFPFALVGMNFTRMLIRLVRKESLNRHFIRQKKLISVMMDLYCAIWHKFQIIWQKTEIDLLDLSTVTTTLEHDIIVKPIALLSQFHRAQKKEVMRTSNPEECSAESSIVKSFKRTGLKLSASSSSLRSHKYFL